MARAASGRRVLGWIAPLVAPVVGPLLGRGGPERETRRLGRMGERAAARFLRRAGYRVLGRNLTLRVGEADLVCLAPDRRTIVVVEVKTRRCAPPGPDGRVRTLPPELNVDRRKHRKLLAVTRALVRLNRWEGRPVRIDVIAVEWPQRGRPVVRHHVGAVGGR